MAEKVEVVIKIPKYYLTHPQDYSCLAECVRRGIILPKGHGRLIDIDKAVENEETFRKYFSITTHPLMNGKIINCVAPSVVEADMGEE